MWALLHNNRELEIINKLRYYCVTWELLNLAFFQEQYCLRAYMELSAHSVC